VSFFVSATAIAKVALLPVTAACPPVSQIVDDDVSPGMLSKAASPTDSRFLCHWAQAGILLNQA